MPERICAECDTVLPQGVHHLRRLCDTCRKRHTAQWRSSQRKRRNPPVLRLCEACDSPLPEGSRSTRRFCEQCRTKRAKAATLRYFHAHPERRKRGYPTRSPEQARRYMRNYRRTKRSGKPPEYWQAFDERKQQRMAGTLQRYTPTRLSAEEAATFAEAKQEWQRRYRRVYNKRRKGQMLCYYCEEPIPPEKLKRHKDQWFCKPACFYAHQKALGAFHRMSKRARAASERSRLMTGHTPGHGKRAYYFDSLSLEERRALSRRAADIHWKDKPRDPKAARSRLSYWRRKMQANPHLVKIVQETIIDARKSGLDEHDAYWLAVGALTREARAQAVIGEELTPEMHAAIQALVTRVLRDFPESPETGG